MLAAVTKNSTVLCSFYQGFLKYYLVFPFSFTELLVCEMFFFTPPSRHAKRRRIIAYKRTLTSAFNLATNALRARLAEDNLNEQQVAEHDITLSEQVSNSSFTVDEQTVVDTTTADAVIETASFNQHHDSQFNADSSFLHDFSFNSSSAAAADDDLPAHEGSQENTSDQEQLTESETLESDLAKIYLRFKVNHKAVEGINRVLRKHGLKVPKTARAHLKTVRKAPFIKAGELAHFSLADSIKKRLASGFKNGYCTRSADLQFNIDGIPLNRNGRKTFWVVSGRLVNANNDSPFPVTVYFGTTKPRSAKTFLTPFINELKVLIHQGVDFNCTNFSVVARAFICDAQARSFVKGIVAHGGYGGCECVTNTVSTIRIG